MSDCLVSADISLRLSFLFSRRPWLGSSGVSTAADESSAASVLLGTQIVPPPPLCVGDKGLHSAECPPQSGQGAWRIRRWRSFSSKKTRRSFSLTSERLAMAASALSTLYGTPHTGTALEAQKEKKHSLSCMWTKCGEGLNALALSDPSLTHTDCQMQCDDAADAVSCCQSFQCIWLLTVLFSVNNTATQNVLNFPRWINLKSVLAHQRASRDTFKATWSSEKRK